VAAITVYFDDSGTHTTSKIAIAAAWIAPFKMWQRFIAEWDRARAKHDFKVFHASEFAANNEDSEFADRAIWNEAKKKVVLARLAQIIRTRTAQGYGLAVDKKDYNEVLSEKQREVTGKHHYSWAVRSVIGSIERWRLKSKIEEPTEYIFDRMTRGDAKNEINAIFADAESRTDTLHRFGIYKGCHSFRDKADVLPLQAADLTAWLFFQQAMYVDYGKQPNPLAIEPWDTLLGNRNHFEGSGVVRAKLAEWVSKEVAHPKSPLYGIK
jgi:hypothetical protein